MNKLSSRHKVIEMSVVTRETVSARDYLNVNKTKPSEIKKATFVAPKIGGKGFGSFDVEYRIPKLVEA